MAVGRDHKLNAAGKPVPGGVGHDRIQQGSGQESIGEAIRRWYGLKRGDFERIDVDVRLHSAGHFILAPTAVTLRGKSRSIPTRKPLRPLSFHHDLQSRLWKDQIESIKSKDSATLAWASEQIQGVVNDHRDPAASNISEADLLRTAGALGKLGLRLGPYLLSGYDCQKSVFRFASLPEYVCPVEVKKRSGGFVYQIENYRTLPRAVVLCITHDLDNPPEDIDVIEPVPSRANLPAPGGRKKNRIGCAHGRADGTVIGSASKLRPHVKHGTPIALQKSTPGARNGRAWVKDPLFRGGNHGYQTTTDRSAQQSLARRIVRCRNVPASAG